MTEVMILQMKYESLLDFNNEYYGKDFKANAKFISSAVNRMFKQKVDIEEIKQFIKDAIDIHIRAYGGQIQMEKTSVPVKTISSEDAKEHIHSLIKARGLDPEEIRAKHIAKIQAKAGDYHFALNQILGCILDPQPGTSDRTILNQVEKIAKKAFDYDMEEN